jgi:hypothetical protein
LGEKLKQASMSEEIQVRCVEARRDVNALSLLIAANPAVFDARQPLAIDIDRSLRARAHAKDPCVEGGQRNEQKDWEQ